LEAEGGDQLGTASIRISKPVVKKERPSSSASRGSRGSRGGRLTEWVEEEERERHDIDGEGSAMYEEEEEETSVVLRERGELLQSVFTMSAELSKKI
jgi:hypothetical protein